MIPPRDHPVNSNTEFLCDHGHLQGKGPWSFMLVLLLSIDEDRLVEEFLPPDRPPRFPVSSGTPALSVAPAKQARNPWYC